MHRLVDVRRLELELLEVLEEGPSCTRSGSRRTPAQQATGREALNEFLRLVCKKARTRNQQENSAGRGLIAPERTTAAAAKVDGRAELVTTEVFVAGAEEVVAGAASAVGRELACLVNGLHDRSISSSRKPS